MGTEKQKRIRKKAVIDPRTGEVLPWPENTCLWCGLDAGEQVRLKQALPSPECVLREIGCATDLVACGCFAAVVDPTGWEDIEVLYGYWEALGGCDGRVLFFKKPNGLPNSLERQVGVFESFDDLERRDLKYLLLGARQKKRKQADFSRKLTLALRVLSEIKRSPGSSSSRLAEKLECSVRTVQRIIESLRVAGEWIEYDPAVKGWYLPEGRSFLYDIEGEELSDGCDRKYH